MIKLFIILLTLAFSLLSQEFKIYEQNNSEYYAYVFLDENSCMTCMSFVTDFVNKYNSKNNLNITIFYKGVSEEFFNTNVKVKYKAKTVFDNFGLYAKYYNCNANPGFLLLSSNGMAPIKAQQFENDTIIKLLDSILESKQNKSNSIFTNSLLKTAPIVSSNYKIKIYNNSIYILDLKYKNLYIYDKKGTLLKSFDFLELYKEQNLTYLFDFFVFNSDEIILIDSDVNSNRKVVIFNLKNSKFRDYIILPKNNEYQNIGYNVTFDENFKTLYCGIFPNFNLNNKILNDSDKTILKYKNGIITKFGNSNINNSKFKLSQGFWNFIKIFNNKIYEIQNFSSEIIEYDKNSLLHIKSIFPNNKINHFRNFNDNIEDNMNSIYWNNIKNKCSMIEDFLFDSVSKKMYIFFKNHNYPEESKNPFDEENKIESYLYSIKNDGEVENFNFNFGNNFKPIQVNNNKIWVSEVNSNKLYLYIIDIQKLK